MNNFAIISPTCTADSASNLAHLLRIPYVNKDSFPADSPPDMDTKVINWGCSRIPEANVVLNKPRAVRRSLNKLRTFELLSDKVRMPVMTLDKEEAVQWARDGRKVVVRNRVKGCKSQGITISRDPAEIAELPAKFYTRFIAGCTEYRVNTFKNQVLSIYRKDPDGAGDFRFRIQMEMQVPAAVQEMVEATTEHIGLDMFGLDVLLTPKGKHFLLEVNSAPILFQITERRLAKAIKRSIENA